MSLYLSYYYYKEPEAPEIPQANMSPFGNLIRASRAEGKEKHLNIFSLFIITLSIFWHFPYSVFEPPTVIQNCSKS